MHVTTRVSNEYHAFRVWISKASDELFYLCLQYIQKIFPTAKYPDFKVDLQGEKEHKARPPVPEKELHVIERHDTPMRDNLVRFKKGKKLGR